MKLGEIKIEALKLMFASDGLSPKVSDLSELSNDENYKFYLSAMNGSINRCLSIIEQAGVVPPAYAVLSKTAGTFSNGFISFDLESLNIDAEKILNVCAYDCLNFEDKNLEFVFVNGLLNVEQFGSEEIIIKYIPKIARILDNADNTLEICLPESYLNMMAHYIKGELYSEDEPELARQSSEIFKKFLSGLHGRSAGELKVKTIYSQTEM